MLLSLRSPGGTRLSRVVAIAAIVVAGGLAGCTTDSGPEPSSHPGGGESVPTEASTPGGSSTPESTVGIGMDEAASIATKEYGGEVITVESDRYRGAPAWEVEIRDSREGRIEVKVDKASGEILHMEHDD